MSREAITSWLLDQGEQVTGLRELTQALCAQWRQAGFAVDRVNLGVFALHPQMAGYAVVWEPELDEAIEIAVRREDMDTPMYLNSPIHWLVERGGSFVADLRRPKERARFAVFEEFSERGFEAYLGERIDYGDGGVSDCRAEYLARMHWSGIEPSHADDVQRQHAMPHIEQHRVEALASQAAGSVSNDSRDVTAVTNDRARPERLLGQTPGQPERSDHARRSHGPDPAAREFAHAAHRQPGQAPVLAQ